MSGNSSRRPEEQPDVLDSRMGSRQRPITRMRRTHDCHHEWRGTEAASEPGTENVNDARVARKEDIGRDYFQNELRRMGEGHESHSSGEYDGNVRSIIS